MKEIELSKKGTKYRGMYKALVDDDVFDIVDEYSWTYNSGYARNRKMNISLHRFIWTLKFGEIPSGLEVEHWDENGLNCTISNLRLATHSENVCNVTKRKDNKSGVKGICKKVKKREREDGSIYMHENWHAEIRKDYRKKTEKIYTKDFDYTAEGFEQAKKWIEQKSLEVHKEFSIYNKDKE
jgi:hypothetical protein